MTALEDARATRSRIDDRLAVARLGKSMYREMDRDMLALKEAGAALDALIAEHERLTAPPADNEREARDAFIEGAKLDARNSMRHDPRVWHEALEAALDKVLPEFWDRAAGFRRQGPITDAQPTFAGRIVTASFEDGVAHEPYCGLEGCECPDHDGPPLPAGTYITIRLDEDAPVGLWPVTVSRVALEAVKEAAR